MQAVTDPGREEIGLDRCIHGDAQRGKVMHHDGPAGGHIMEADLGVTGAG